MKKILMLSILFSMIALVPQITFAQTDVEPVKQEVKAEKQKAVKKEMKEQSATTTTVEQKNKSAEKAPVAKKGEQPQINNYIVPSKAKPREAVIAPVKNPKNNKVTEGKKIDKKDKDKNKDKKLHKVQKMN
jgi:transcription elongation GreA/GreB family factor